MGIPLRAGRDFRDADHPATAEAPAGPRVTIVNESFVKRFFAGRNPIGQRISFTDRFDPARAFEVIGVAGDVNYHGLRQAPAPMAYTSVWWLRANSRTLIVRTADTAGVAEAVRRHVTSLDATLPVLAVRTIEDYVDNNLLVDRLLATLSGFFGLLALLLAAVGLYGVVSYAVTRRTREIGVRMALGAERVSVLWLVARYAGGLVLAGAAIGIPAALALSKYVKSFLFGIGPQDGMAIAGATATLLVAAAVAAFLPARRATNVDPIVALRHE
jgi:predicted permease